MSYEYGAVDLSAAIPQNARNSSRPERNPQEAPSAPSAEGGVVMDPQDPPAAAGAGRAPGHELDAPLVVTIDETSLETAMALSQSVPVVLLAYAPNSLPSKQALKTVEEVVRQEAGALQLGTVDVETNPTLANALQLQTVPAAYALVARRPIPLFEGAPTADQVRQVLGELLVAAREMGVTGRLQVAETDLEAPMPPEHTAARDAEMEGNWAGAIAAWKKVLANDPGDQEAKVALQRAEFEQRLEAGADAADQLFATGQEAEAFEVLLQRIDDAADPGQKEELRQQLVQLFTIAADTQAVRLARNRLATMLLV